MRFASAKQRSEQVIIDLMNKYPDRVSVNGLPYDPAAKTKRVNKWTPYRNQTECRYARRLEMLKAGGQILDWQYERFRCDITTGEILPVEQKISRTHTTYRPDFRVEMPDRSIQWHEVKGFERDAGIQRWRASASQHPEAKWFLVKLIKEQWIFKEFGERQRSCRPLHMGVD